MKVFSKVNGKLAAWDVNTDNPKEARELVKSAVGVILNGPILALVHGSSDGIGGAAPMEGIGVA